MLPELNTSSDASDACALHLLFLMRLHHMEVNKKDADKALEVLVGSSTAGPRDALMLLVRGDQASGLISFQPKCKRGHIMQAKEGLYRAAPVLQSSNAMICAICM